LPHSSGIPGAFASAGHWPLVAPPVDATGEAAVEPAGEAASLGAGETC
jgi:hypothetical protein